MHDILEPPKADRASQCPVSRLPMPLRRSCRSCPAAIRAASKRSRAAATPRSSCAATSLDPPPAFASARMGTEMTELYWRALTRDVPFREYESYPLVAAAVTDLNA